jgi:hypothetical protein
MDVGTGIGTTKLNIHQEIYKKLNYFYESNKMPHIIFHGLPGSGKRTIMNDFLNKIYQDDKQKIKTNVMIVNCAHGKGIKFIREELKFFAKTNIQLNNGILFKSVVLLNADFLTIDAQSALRRCIEVFSYNTRFFILVENKEKLLKPILSRFCEIYVPNDYIIKNLHTYSINRNYQLPSSTFISKTHTTDNMAGIKTKETTELVHLSRHLYENGSSVMDLIEYIQGSPEYTTKEKSIIQLQFERVRSEFRCEKYLFLYMMDFIRSKKEIKVV